jgi:hypothetical protein
MLPRDGKNTLLRAAFYGEKCRRRRVLSLPKGGKTSFSVQKMAFYGI